MWKTTIILTISLILEGHVRAEEGVSCNCGIPNGDEDEVQFSVHTESPGSDYIYGGDQTRGHTYPWIVSVQDGSCGGALISARHVLTAAHCFFYRDSNIRSPIGSVGYASYKESNTMQASVSQVEINPTFNSVPHYGSDTAIVTLTEPITFGDNVRPLCLPSDPRYGRYKNQEAIAAGWGATETGRTNELKETRVHILSKRRCYRLTKRRNFTPRFQKRFELCSLGTNNVRFGTRPGDSGSVLFLRENSRYTGIAVNSRESNPDIFARITSEVYEWIKKKSNGTKDSKCEAIN